MLIDIVLGGVICYLLIVVNRLTKAILRINHGYGEALKKMATQLEQITQVVNYHTTKITEYEEIFNPDMMEELDLGVEFELLDPDEDGYDGHEDFDETDENGKLH